VSSWTNQVGKSILWFATSLKASGQLSSINMILDNQYCDDIPQPIKLILLPELGNCSWSTTNLEKQNGFPQRKSYCKLGDWVFTLLVNKNFDFFSGFRAFNTRGSFTGLNVQQLHLYLRSNYSKLGAKGMAITSAVPIQN